MIITWRYGVVLVAAEAVILLVASVEVASAGGATGAGAGACSEVEVATETEVEDEAACDVACSGEAMVDVAAEADLVIV